MFDILEKYLKKPELYAESTDKFWDDDHISKGMLESHLNPNWDLATRKSDFIIKSVDWITTIAPSEQYPKLLDLGCGPGLYAERFRDTGYCVTGIDFSKRSVNHAKEQAALNESNIQYYYQNYLNINYNEEFDVITLIYCDFGVLSTGDRLILLDKAYKALKPGGKLIFDVFTAKQYEGKEEQTSWEYYENGGFWSFKPHLCLNTFYRYDEDSTVLNQTILADHEAINCYNIWEHCFSEASLILEIKSVGFNQIRLYGDIAGQEYSQDGKTICVVVTK